MVVEEEAEEKAEEVTNEGAEEKTEKVMNKGAVRYQCTAGGDGSWSGVHSCNACLKKGLRIDLSTYLEEL